MSKFKVGDRVRVVAHTRITYHSKIGITGIVKKIQNSTETNYPITVVRDTDNENEDFNEKDLELAEKTLEDLEVGDTLVDEDGDEVKILGIKKSYILSAWGNCDEDDEWTIKELQQNGFKFKSPSTETVLTLQEVADKFNCDVKQLRIKD